MLNTSLFNPWHSDPAFKQTGIKRTLFEPLLESLNNHYVTILKGARQTGKTFLIKQLISHLLEKKVPAKSIYYFSFDDFELLNYVENNPTALRSYIIEESQKFEKLFVFIDEFQKASHLTDLVKSIYESNAKIKFILSGSSSLMISQKVSESLLGRTDTFHLFPLSFFEVASFNIPENEWIKDLSNITALFLGSPKKYFSQLKKKYLQHHFRIRQLDPLFEKYLLAGGYPQVVQSRETMLRLREILQVYLEKDIVLLLRIKNLNDFEKLLKFLASMTGNLVNYSDLQKEIGISFQTLKKFLNILEQTYFVRLLPPFYKSQITSLKKMPKVFFNDLGIRNYLASIYSLNDIPKDIGPIAENYIFCFLMRYNSYVNKDMGRLFYWRNIDKNEIDFIYTYGKHVLPVEVKYRTEAKISRGNQEFLKLHKLKEMVIVSRGSFEERFINGVTYYLVPMILFM